MAWDSSRLSKLRAGELRKLLLLEDVEFAAEEDTCGLGSSSQLKPVMTDTGLVPASRGPEFCFSMLLANCLGMD